MLYEKNGPLFLACKIHLNLPCLYIEMRRPPSPFKETFPSNAVHSVMVYNAEMEEPALQSIFGHTEVRLSQSQATTTPRAVPPLSLYFF